MHMRPRYIAHTMVLTVVLMSGCGQDPTAVRDGELEPTPDGWIDITLRPDGPTRDWGGVEFSVEEIGGGPSTGRYLARLGGLAPPTYNDRLPAGDYTFRIRDVDPFCSLGGPSEVSVSPNETRSVSFTLHCGPLTEEPAGGLLAVPFAGTFLLAEPDGTSMRFFLPETRQAGCGIDILPTASPGGPNGVSDAGAPCSFHGLDWCSDGSRIALRSGSPFDNGVYTTSGAGGQLARLDDGSILLDLDSGVSTDRGCSRVAFAAPARDGSGTVAVHSIPMEGGTPTLVVDSAAEPAWSPVDDRIAVVREGQVVVMDETMSSIELGPGRCPGWAPDGIRVAFADGGDVRVANADGSGPPETVSTTSSSTVWCPRWSPDGSWIAYQADTSTGALTGRDVFLVRVVDGWSYRLTYWGGSLAPGVAWVPTDAPVHTDASGG